MFPGIKFPWKFSLNLSKFLQARINVFLFRFLPFSVSRGYLALLGGIYYLVKRKEKKLIKNTVIHIFKNEMDSRSLNRLIWNIFRGIFEHYHEKLYVGFSNFPRLLKSFKNRINVTGEEDFQASLAKGNGLILVTGHYGAVEFLPGALAVRDYPVTMILRFQTESLRNSLMKRVETLPNLELVDSDEGHVFHAALKALKQGRILVTECDEFDEWRPSKTKKVNFLKTVLAEDRTLETLQACSGAAVSTALMQRNGGLNYTLNLSHILCGTDKDKKETISHSCLNVLEKAIRNTPDHWYQWKKFGKMLNLDSKPQNENEQDKVIEENQKISLPM